MSNTLDDLLGIATIKRFHGVIESLSVSTDHDGVGRLSIDLRGTSEDIYNLAKAFSEVKEARGATISTESRRPALYDILREG